MTFAGKYMELANIILSEPHMDMSGLYSLRSGQTLLKGYPCYNLWTQRSQIGRRAQGRMLESFSEEEIKQTLEIDFTFNHRELQTILELMFSSDVIMEVREVTFLKEPNCILELIRPIMDSCVFRKHSCNFLNDILMNNLLGEACTVVVGFPPQNIVL